MFTPEEREEIVTEAVDGLPMSVSMSPEDLNISPETKAKIRKALIAAIKALFTSFTGIPVPVQSGDQPLP
jgi:hypothetical protein